MKLIQNYIGNTTISLNSFALLELKAKSKDTFLEYNQSIFQYARSRNCNISIIYYENKIIIYGEPNYRKKLYDILSDYFLKLQKEKIIYSLKGKEDSLFLKNICKKINQKQIVMLVSKNENGENQLEFRKKYINIITNILNTQKKKKTTNKIKSTICEICLEKFDNENNNNYFKLKLCGHKFCIDCLKSQICNSLKPDSLNTIPIKCIKCNTIITNKDIFEIEPDKPHNKSCQIKLYSNLTEKNREWIINNSKACPICHTVYEKNHGCNHMTCKMCFPPTHFCYLCGCILNQINPLKHFSNKESLCYNKLWDDPDKKDISLLKEINTSENSKEYNDSIEEYNNSYKIRKRRDDLNLTRIMINKVSHNESYKSSYYRNINSHFRKNRDNDNRYKRNNSYNKKFVPNFKK